MAETITKETTTVVGEQKKAPSAPVIVTPNVETSQTIGYIVYFIFGVIEILLLFRFILKLTGANPASGFVNFIYALTQIFIMPFVGIFSSATAQGAETVAVFEPATIVAMIVYAVLAWGIAQLVVILSGKLQE